MVHRVKSGGAAVLEVQEKSSSCGRKAGSKQGSRKKTQGLADAFWLAAGYVLEDGQWVLER